MREIPYVVVESMIAEMERTIKRLWILCLVLIVLCVGSNVAWIIYESQFETVTETTTQEVTQGNDGGDNIVVGGDYGKTDSKDNNH